MSEWLLPVTDQVIGLAAFSLLVARKNVMASTQGLEVFDRENDEVCPLVLKVVVPEE